MNKQAEIRVDELVYKSLEGIISEQECRELEIMLSSDSDAPEYYVSSIELNNRILKIKDSMNTPLQMMMAFEELGKNEQTAPAVDIAPLKKSKVLIQNVQYPKIDSKIYKKSLFTLIAAAAAIVLIFVFAKFTPPETGIKIAVLADSINARWADRGETMVKGSPFFTSREKLLLREGYANLLFDNRAQVIIEGPAEFQVLAEDKIALRYGKLYAMVPTEAIGFVVTTQTAKVIDLGTEFGVTTEVSGNTELYVMKGKTLLLTGDKNNKVNVEVSGGAAKKIFGIDGRVLDIMYEQDKFVRKISSASKRIWRGENLSLASIVAGLDGFREAKSLVGLDPSNGKFTKSITYKDRFSNNTYSLVKDSDFIDGVFVPDGRSGAIQITSLGHTFDCPNTSGVFTHEIAAYKGDIEGQHTTIPSAVFMGNKYENNSIVILHSNIGITFDLQEIRRSLPQLELKSFKARGGLSEELRLLAGERADIDLWILVDGQVKYEKNAFKIDDGLVSFNIELGPQDRFLTLIVTDGRTADDKRTYPYGSDFFYLIEPELCLTGDVEK